MTFDKMGFETMYEFQLDWPQGVDQMSIWAEGLNGDEVIGTSSKVMVTKEGQGGNVDDQSGVGSGETNSNSTLSGGGNSGNSGNTTSQTSQDNGASTTHVASAMILAVAGAVSLMA